jgi:hypothetical protein
MTRKEAARLALQEQALMSLGFTADEAEKLRRISMTLQRWHELECGTGEGQVSRSVERENADGTGRPFMRVQYPTANGYHDKRYPIADRETGARKRLQAILKARNNRVIEGARVQVVDGVLYAHFGEAPGPFQTVKVANLSAYIQTDPRGAALYILRPGDVPDGASADSYYSRGVCVY